MLTLRQWRGSRAQKDAGHIAWMYHTQPWTRPYAVQRFGRSLYAVRRDNNRIIGRAGNLTALTSVILADVQATQILAPGYDDRTRADIPAATPEGLPHGGGRL